MATTRVVYDGPVALVEVLSVAAETVSLDVSALLSGSPAEVVVQGIQASRLPGTNFNAVFSWDADTDVPFAWVNDGGTTQLEYVDPTNRLCDWGLTNNSGTGKTGDIVIVTTGTPGALNILLWLRKR